MNTQPRAMPVLILHNEPPPGAGESDAGVLAAVNAVSAALSEAGTPFEAAGVRRFTDIPAVLTRSRRPVVFNLVEGFASGASDAMLVPAVCRAFGIEATGGDTPCLALTLDKWRTRQALAAAGLAVPAGILVEPGDTPATGLLPRGPCIVKPSALDASEGIDSHCVVDRNDDALNARVREIHHRFHQPALIEELVGRREINVSIIRRDGATAVLPLAEIDFSGLPPGLPPIVGYRAKWIASSPEFAATPRIVPAPVDDAVAVEIRRMALAAWEATGCRDYARVDFRLTADGSPVILEVNPNPDLSPDAGFAAACKAAGIAFRDAVCAIVRNASLRANSSLECSARNPDSPPRRPAGPNAMIRPAHAGDRRCVEEMVCDRDFFRTDEVGVAMEVFDDALRPGNPESYYSFVIEVDEEPAGWICHGPIPCTTHSYDIYWIVVHRERRLAGLGSALIRFAEDDIRRRGGRIAVIETSDRPVYASTMAFYAANGYRTAAALPDFYAPGDAKVILTKAL